MPTTGSAFPGILAACCAALLALPLSPAGADTTATLAGDMASTAPQDATTTATPPATRDAAPETTLSATAQAEATWRPGVARSRFASDEPEDLGTSPTVHRDLEGRADGAARFEPASSGRHGPVGRQPKGSLSGRIVYASAGHGWTWHTTTSLWYTQRPLTHGMVEDMGNIDQNNLFVDYCFRAGATVVPMRPVGFQSAERIVDNESADARFQGEWRDSTSTLHHGPAHARVPYRFAVATRDDASVARYGPFFPKADWYPVYCWARDGADRVEQTYRVAHAGGVTEVRVDHRRVGKGWVYLGEYYFGRGRGGFVEITSRVDDGKLADGRHVVIADAIRFGNGMGDVNRGGGISGRPREQEASRYWVERALAGAAPPIFDAVEDAGDQANNVGTPPRMASHMNRETDGTFFDRIYHGFHSNAVGGRGVVGLFNNDEEFRPDKQVEFAELVARCVNEEMRVPGVLAGTQTWAIHPKLTDSHINFGEIRRDYLNNEMTATITEVAFHDNAQDAELLRSPRARLAFARACYRAVGLFFERHHPDKPAFVAVPEAPRLVAVRLDGDAAGVRVRWNAPGTAEAGAAPATGYRVHRSADGFAFDDGLEITTGTELLVAPVTPGRAEFFRVSAFNAGGASAPSAVLGACAPRETTRPVALLLAGFTSLNEDLNLTQTEEQCLGSPMAPGGSLARIIPRLMNPGTQVAEVGRALARAGYAFESRTIADFEGEEPGGKPAPVTLVLAGRQSLRDGLFSPALLRRLAADISKGGNVVMSGANVLAALDGDTWQVTGETRAFARVTLGTAFGGFGSGLAAVKPVEGSELSTVTVRLDTGAGPFESAFGPDMLMVQPGARALMTYDVPGGGPVAAVLHKPDESGGTAATFAFPLEHVAGDAARAALLEALLVPMGVAAGPAIAPAEASAARPRAARPQPTPRTRQGRARR